MDIGERQNLNEEIGGVVELILEDYSKGRDVDQLDVFNQPDRDVVTDIVKKLLRILRPSPPEMSNMSIPLRRILNLLNAR